jgi:hypothetical protein
MALGAGLVLSLVIALGTELDPSSGLASPEDGTREGASLEKAVEVASPGNTDELGAIEGTKEGASLLKAPPATSIAVEKSVGVESPDDAVDTGAVEGTREGVSLPKAAGVASLGNELGTNNGKSEYTSLGNSLSVAPAPLARSIAVEKALGKESSDDAVDTGAVEGTREGVSLLKAVGVASLGNELGTNDGRSEGTSLENVGSNDGRSEGTSLENVGTNDGRSEGTSLENVGTNDGRSEGTSLENVGTNDGRSEGTSLENAVGVAPVGRVAELGTDDGTREGASLENAAGLASLCKVELGANAGASDGTSLENASGLSSPVTASEPGVESSEDASMDV